MTLTAPTSTDSAPQRPADIVLAAGTSSRMGRLKPLLRLGGIAALQRTIALFRSLLFKHEHSTGEIPVADEAIHLDVDTPAAFIQLHALAARHEIPTTGECEAILAGRNLPDAVIRHSRKVAEIAGQIAQALAATGLSISSELARAGGLLHDLAKGQPNHAKAAADFLRACKMPAVANVVAAHTEMDFAGVIDERAIVYLADKLANSDRLVTLDERFQQSLFRFRDHPDALEAARRHKAVAEQVAGTIEARLGMPLLAILSQESALPAHELKVAATKEDSL